ncbi:unnamed protein product [Parajaminaea phylloscopi]
MVAKCPSINTVEVEQEDFWSDVTHGQWGPHRIGWAIAGIAAAVTLAITAATVMGHALHYHRPSQQRQIIRILLFPAVFAIVSFFGYRFFRYYTYYELVEVVWEAVAIAAFLMLCLDYIAQGGDKAQRAAFADKDKHKLPLPLCCWRYRPTKAKFLTLLKASVVQYCLVRPALSIAGIVLEYYGLLCSQSLSYRYGHVYLTAVDFVSISIALYGLIVFYELAKKDLAGRRPLAKFMSIKLAIFFTFYQSFVFSILQSHGVIKGTRYWTGTNVADGLNSLATCLEMVLVAAFQAWAFHWGEYRQLGKQRRDDWVSGVVSKDGDSYENKKRHAQPSSSPQKRPRLYTNPLWAIVHSLWLGDLFYELWRTMRFAFDRMRGREYTRQDVRFTQRQSKAYDFGSVGALRHEAQHQAEAAAAAGRTATPGGSAAAANTAGVGAGGGMDFSHVFFAAAAAKNAHGAGINGHGSQSYLSGTASGHGGAHVHFEGSGSSNMQGHEWHEDGVASSTDARYEPYGDSAWQQQQQQPGRSWPQGGGGPHRQNGASYTQGGETFELMPTPVRSGSSANDVHVGAAGRYAHQPSSAAGDRLRGGGGGGHSVYSAPAASTYFPSSAGYPLQAVQRSQQTQQVQHWQPSHPQPSHDSGSGPWHPERIGSPPAPTSPTRPRHPLYPEYSTAPLTPGQVYGAPHHQHQHVPAAVAQQPTYNNRTDSATGQIQPSTPTTLLTTTASPIPSSDLVRQSPYDAGMGAGNGREADSGATTATGWRPLSWEPQAM